MTDLLNEAKTPLPDSPPWSARTSSGPAGHVRRLKLEKALSREGIPLFATDEPASIEGVNATTVLVRRVKQGMAEWYRLQLKEKTWKGLQEHSLAGWNIGFRPYGYTADRVDHPSPAKAAQGRTKSRLPCGARDPVRAAVVDQIYTWRVIYRLSVRAITSRLNADPACPPPDGRPYWTQRAVTVILANPKYTGHMVYGRTRKVNGRKRPVPAGQWIWSPEPTHPPSSAARPGTKPRR
jgi:site-specific DNA recombinase